MMFAEWDTDLTHFSRETPMASKSNFSSFPKYFVTCLVSMLKKTRITLRDMRLFEINESRLYNVKQNKQLILGLRSIIKLHT